MAEVQSANCSAVLSPENQREAINKILLACQRPGLGGLISLFLCGGGGESRIHHILLFLKPLHRTGELHLGL